MADDKIIKSQIIAKIVVIIILIGLIFTSQKAIERLDELAGVEPKYQTYYFELGNATLKHNNETIKIEIMENGTYRLTEVYEKTNTKEFGSGWNLGNAPLEARINGCNIANDYFGREVLYLKLERIDTGETEYVEVK